MCEKITVRMFGKLCIQRDDDAQIVIESRKALNLLAYLLIYRRQPHTRETLAEANWGDGSTTRSKKYLRQALWQVRSALNYRNNSDCSSILIVEPDWVQLNPEAPLWLDVAEFEQACALAQRTPLSGLSAQDFVQLKKAAELYQGDLLDGWYEDWCLFERERLQNMCVGLFDKLMAYCELQNRYEDALEYGNHILRLDVAHERTHCRMLAIYYLSGERTAALRQYERCVTALRDELGVKPARETIELYERIRDDQEAEHLPSLDPAPAELSTTVLLQRLDQLKHMMVTFQDQVLAEINAIETTLNRNGSKTPPDL